jgi:HSP20 family protein
MSRIVRLDPYREPLSIRQLMDRFINEPMTGLRPWGDASIPSVDMYQTDDEIVVKATLPGVKAEDIAISVTGDVLTLRGSTAEEKEVQEASYYLRERRSGEFSRSLPLPAAVIADKAQAEFEDGILRLTLPKAEEIKPKTITVKAK